MQCSMTMKNCDVTALLWFYGEGKNTNLSELQRSSRLIQSVEITDNCIYGGLSIKGVQNVLMQNNQLLEKNAPVLIKE